MNRSLWTHPATQTCLVFLLAWFLFNATVASFGFDWTTPAAVQRSLLGALAGQAVLLMVAAVAITRAPPDSVAPPDVVRRAEGPRLLLCGMLAFGCTPALNLCLSWGWQSVLGDHPRPPFTSAQLLTLFDDPLGCWLVAGVVTLPALAEELFFRGWMQARLVGRLPAVMAIGWSSLWFTAFHLDPRGALVILPLGLWLGTLFHVSRRLWVPVLGHFANNLTTVLLIAFSGE